MAQRGVKSQGLHVDGKGWLIVPLRDVDGVLHSVQTISPDGKKMFLDGGRKHGLFHTIGEIDPAGVIGICEGYATAATVHEATGIPAVVAFDCGNLLPVAEALRKKHPSLAFIFFADDDWKRVNTRGELENIGVIKAREAAAAVGGRVVVPVFSGSRGDKETDFNDLAKLEGPDAVQRCLDAAETIEAATSTADVSFDLDAEVERLARLKILEYERIRKDEAERLGIDRISALDEAVKQARAQYAAEKAAPEISGEALEPWPDSVDGGGILSELIAALRSHVILPRMHILP